MKVIPGFAAYLLTETDIVIVKDGEFEVPVKDNKVTLTNDKGVEKTVSLGFLKEMAEPMEDEDNTSDAPEAKEAPKAEEEPKAEAKPKGKKKDEPKKAVKTGKKDEGLKVVKKDEKKKPAEKAKPEAKAKVSDTKKAKAKETANKWAEKKVKTGDKLKFIPFGQKKEIEGTVVRTYLSTSAKGSWFVILKSGKKSYKKVATSIMPK